MRREEMGMAELASKIDRADREKAALRAVMRGTRASISAAERERLSEAACQRALALPEVRVARSVAAYSALGTELSLDGLVGELGASGVELLAPVTLTGRRMASVPVSADELLTHTGGLSPHSGQPRHADIEAGSHAAAGLEEQPAFLAHPERPLVALPANRVPVPPDDIDIMFVPGLAFDKHGMRLGYGAGYYDAWLAQGAGSHPLLVGICFDEQLVGHVPAESHDHPVAVVVTPTRTLRVDCHIRA